MFYIRTEIEFCLLFLLCSLLHVTLQSVFSMNSLIEATETSIIFKHRCLYDQFKHIYMLKSDFEINNQSDELIVTDLCSRNS